MGNESNGLTGVLFKIVRSSFVGAVLTYILKELGTITGDPHRILISWFAISALLSILDLFDLWAQITKKFGWIISLS